MYIDTHAHFDLVMEEGSVSEAQIMENMKASGVETAVQVSVDAAGSAWSRDFAARHAGDGLLFTIGIHPSSRADDSELGRLAAILEDIRNSGGSKLLLGIGECGLDYYRMHQERAMQINSFIFQIDLANRCGLPVIVHSRDAMEDTVSILRKECKTGGIMHCFPGDKNAAQKVLDLGMYLSFAGNVTYRAAAALHESALYAPLDRLLVETDAPFLTPVPLRGKKNRTEYVIHTYRYLSELRKEPLERIISTIRKNFMEIAGNAVKNL